MNVVLRDRDRGETLVEIVLAVVIIGVSVTALVSALATAANASVVQRESVIADTTLRNMAETAKAAGRDCVEGTPIDLALTPPDGWQAVTSPGAPLCPAPTAPLHLDLVVVGPDGRTSTLQVVVRSS
jgi:type II secretory pathway pseudopilin PulG